MKVAVVILNYNGAAMLGRFLPSVVKYSPDAEIVVADNASTDDSVAVVAKDFPGVRLIQLDRNYGFADGYNKALEQVDAEYFVLLNSDVEVTEGWLEPMLSLMEKNADVVACQPKILAYMPVAQLDRVSDSDSEGRAFESHRAYHPFPRFSGKGIFLSFFLCY